MLRHIILYCTDKIHAVNLLRWPRLPVETSLPLEFGATPVNESKVSTLSTGKIGFWKRNIHLEPKNKSSFYLLQVKTFMLKNPSSSVVSVEIRTLALYPAPLEALDLLTKWYAVISLCLIVQRIIQLHLFWDPAGWSSVYIFSCSSLWLIPSNCFDWQVQYEPPLCQHQHHRVFSVGFSFKGNPWDHSWELKL